jgi:hypothetical protein
MGPGSPVLGLNRADKTTFTSLGLGRQPDLVGGVPEIAKLVE